MPEDPVVKEIHDVREELLNEYGGFDGYMQHIEELQRKLGDRVVTREPRPPIAVERKIS
jgi:hypothetical protein